MAPGTKTTNIITRVLATAAVWAIAIVFAEKVKVRTVDIILLVLSVALTIAIWAQPAQEERN